MSRNNYYPGALVTVQGIFETVAASPVAIDPVGVITLVIEGPNNILTTLPQANLTKTGTGTWTYAIDTTGYAPGVWGYRFYSQAGLYGQAANESAFVVNESFAT